MYIQSGSHSFWLSGKHVLRLQKFCKMYIQSESFSFWLSGKRVLRLHKISQHTLCGWVILSLHGCVIAMCKMTVMLKMQLLVGYQKTHSCVPPVWQLCLLWCIQQNAPWCVEYMKTVSVHARRTVPYMLSDGGSVTIQAEFVCTYICTYVIAFDGMTKILRILLNSSLVLCRFSKTVVP